MGTKLGVVVMSALLVLYLVAVAQLSISLIIADDWLAKAIGMALVVLPAIGAWAMASELIFGLRSQKLSDRFDDEGALPLGDLPKRPSGRPDRGAADAAFPQFRDEAEKNPDDWRAWFQLGLAYDASGDRRRGRQAIRRAISLERRVQ